VVEGARTTKRGSSVERNFIDQPILDRGESPLGALASWVVCSGETALLVKEGTSECERRSQDPFPISGVF